MIKTESEYLIALDQIDRMMDQIELGSDEQEALDDLLEAVIEYETKADDGFGG